MRHFRKSTIKEVAAQAGVSVTTVSMFVSGRETVCAPETAERIRRAVADLHYTPSSLTRGLRRQVSRTVGVCLPSPLDPDLAYGATFLTFLERLWRGVVREADHAGYSLLHYPLDVRGGHGCGAFLDGRVDGMILHGYDTARAEVLAAAGMPMVLLNRSRRLPDGCGAVQADEGRTADLALSHLWGLGHRRIAHVAGPVGAEAGVGPGGEAAPPHDDIAVLRLEGYVRWMRGHGVYDPRLVAYARAWAAPQAGDLVARWLSLGEPPTAVFCANDAQAREVIAAAQAQGLTVPAGLSVVGVDDAAPYWEGQPALTTVNVQIEEVGREALAALLRLMRGETLGACRVMLPLSRLVVRHSTAPTSRLLPNGRAHAHRIAAEPAGNGPSAEQQRTVHQDLS